MSQTSTLRWSYRLAAGFTLGAVVLGSAVCATESGMACPAWPGCFPGQLTPDSVHSAIEFTHRVVAFGSLVTLGVAGWHGRRLPDPRLRWFPVAALLAAIASGAFGMMIVLFSLPLALGVLDVAAAQVALCLITWAAVRLEARPVPSKVAPGLARWGWATVGVVIVMHLLGIVVAGEGSLVRCLGWPVWRIVATDNHPALQWVRLGLGVVAALMLARLVVLAWRSPSLLRPAALLALAWFTELALGQVIVGQFADGQPRHLGLAAAYSMLAGLIVWLIALLASAAGEGAGPGMRPARATLNLPGANPQPEWEHPQPR